MENNKKVYASKIVELNIKLESYAIEREKILKNVDQMFYDDCHGAKSDLHPLLQIEKILDDLREIDKNIILTKQEIMILNKELSD